MDLSRPRRAALAACAIGLATVMAATVSPEAGAVPSSAPATATEVVPALPDVAPDYTFLSSPDFMNADIADLSRLRTWHRGMPNSWNSAYATTIDTILDSFEAERPDDVFVAGDLVGGHWGRDDDHTGFFGPTRTHRQRKAAIKRAADFYFSQWRRRFDARRLPVYAAVGDHDIGDNPWRGGLDPAWSRLKRGSIQTFKHSLYRNVIAPSRVPDRPHGQAHETAYATYVSPEVLLVTVDVFQRAGGNVIAKLDRLQLRWLHRVLAKAERAGTDWIVVQGHVPVLHPVLTYGTSAIRYRGGARSPFWRVMAKHGVDLYLNGEVHDISVKRADGITQISHGGTIQMADTSGRGSTNYVLGKVYGDTMWLRDNLFVPKSISWAHELWQLDRTNRPVARKVVVDPPKQVGQLVLTSDNQLLASSGRLTPLR